MKTDRAAVGRRGEEEASRYLTRLGHRILARNWRGGHLELDIVTLVGNELHFVEVKSRVAPVMAEPERNVGRTKQRRLVAAAQAFLHDESRAPTQRMWCVADGKCERGRKCFRTAFQKM